MEYIKHGEISMWIIPLPNYFLFHSKMKRKTHSCFRSNENASCFCRKVCFRSIFGSQNYMDITQGTVTQILYTEPIPKFTGLIL